VSNTSVQKSKLVEYLNLRAEQLRTDLRGLACSSERRTPVMSLNTRFASFWFRCYLRSTRLALAKLLTLRAAHQIVLISLNRKIW